ncbi:sigma-70 family RNA polymerase sigma factor [Verrucomicrobiaceae bacterium 227]
MARKAHRLPKGICLGGWLYRMTNHLAANQMRADRRRSKREILSTEIMKINDDRLSREILEELDEALLAIPAKSREIVVMRFFEGCGYRGIAGQFGISEEAARKRVTRSLDALRGILTKRGLKISTPALATGLGILSSDSLSAASQQQIITAAIAAPVAKAGLGMTLAAFLMGAATVSVIGMGVRHFSEPPSAETGSGEQSIARSTRSTASPEQHLLSGEMCKPDLIAEIQKLGEGPKHSLADLTLEILLRQISNEQIPDFVSESMEQLSPEARELCYKKLFLRWAETDPGAANLTAMRLNVGPRSKMNTWLYRSIAGNWARREPEAMSRWLLENWDEIASYQLQEFGTSTIHNFTNSAIDAFESERGIDEALKQLTAFPEDAQLSALKNLTGKVLRKMHESSGPALYQLLKQRSQTPEYRELVRTFFLNWAGKDAEGMLAALDTETPKDKFRAYLNLFGDIQSNGPLVRGAGGELTSAISYRNAFASLAGREELAYRSGLKAGLSETAVWEEIAKTYREIPSVGSFLNLLAETRDHPDLELLREKMGEYSAYLMPAEKLHSPARQLNAAIWNASLLNDEATKRELCGELFEKYLSLDEKEAREFAAAPHLPEDLKSLFQSKLPK